MQIIKWILLIYLFLNGIFSIYNILLVKTRNEKITASFGIFYSILSVYYIWNT
jgi:hypothetical protein